jgi:hypothetical protein
MQMAAFRAATISDDTQPPSAATALAATAASSSQINLAWTAATDNVGVTGYRIERCRGTNCSMFTQVATTSATTFKRHVGLSLCDPPGRSEAAIYSPSGLKASSARNHCRFRLRFAEHVIFDMPRLRSSTSDNYLTTGIAYEWHPHRDTWYSAPQCQINW